MLATVKKLLTVALALALVPTARAAAQDPAGDPQAGSPSGTIYEIPLDQARGDAAPRASVAVAPAGGSPGAGMPAPPEPSSIRSPDNGFSSTATVPGTAAGGTPAAQASAARAPQRARGSNIPAGPQTRLAAASAGSPSVLRSFLLIALGVAVAAALGFAARRPGRRG